jgi:hypothetical protein
VFFQPFEDTILNSVWWYTSVIPALGRLRDGEFETSLYYIVLSQEKKKKKKKKITFII